MMLKNVLSMLPIQKIINRKDCNDQFHYSLFSSSLMLNQARTFNSQNLTEVMNAEARLGLLSPINIMYIIICCVNQFVKCFKLIFLNYFQVLLAFLLSYHLLHYSKLFSYQEELIYYIQLISLLYKLIGTAIIFLIDRSYIILFARLLAIQLCGTYTGLSLIVLSLFNPMDKFFLAINIFRLYNLFIR